MQIILNEQSLPKDLPDAASAVAILEEFVMMSIYALKISNHKPITRHRNLSEMHILPNITIKEFIVSLDDKTRPNLRGLLLQLLLRAPFLKPAHSTDETITDSKGNCLRNSCFDEAAGLHTGAAVLFFPGDSEKLETISVSSSKYGVRKVRCFHNSAEIKEFFWTFAKNEKHTISADKVVNGVVHSAMKLDDVTAQYVLTNGALIGKSIYNIFKDQWYKFNCHEKSKYHGFPIEVKTNYKEFSAALKCVDLLLANEHGQIIWDDLNTN